MKAYLNQFQIKALSALARLQFLNELSVRLRHLNPRRLDFILDLESVLLQRWSAWRSFALIFSSAAVMAGCSQSPTAGVGTGGTGSFNGFAALDVTDAPALNYAHVYVTVTGVAFHTDATAAFSSYSTAKAAGWQIVTLPAPKTIDLAQLTNGTMYADLNGNAPLLSGMALPVGSYQQIRIFLASTEDAYIGSAPGIIYNNEVQQNGDPAHYPLRIPSSDEGIKVLPESPVVVTGGGSVNLALDFNLNDDVVEVSPGGATEFMLKPRLGYFDMGGVGSVKGTVSFTNLPASMIEVKAEQVKSGTNYRIVRRTTSVDSSTGRFTLYPLPVFGNATTATYDIVLRGRNVQTFIITGVKVHKGTTPIKRRNRPWDDCHASRRRIHCTTQLGNAPKRGLAHLLPDHSRRSRSL